MSFFRWLSLILALVSGVLITTWAVLLLGPDWTRAGGSLYTLVLGAVVVALLLGLGHWLATGAYEAELRRLITHLESLKRDDDKQPLPTKSRFGLGELAHVVHETLESMRNRLRTVSRQRRELEVQAHVAEAERRHLEAILNAMTDAVVVTDAFNEIALANDAAARVLSFDLDQSQRRPIDQIVHDPTLVKLVKDTRDGGHASLRRHVEHRIGHNGQTRVYDVTLACVAAGHARRNRAADPGHDASRQAVTAARQHLAAASTNGNGNGNGNGNAAAAVAPVQDNGAATRAAATPAQQTAAAGVVTILRDVTREKEIQEMKSDFVSNVSHELRTPLSSIKAYMEMLVDGEADDEETRTEFYNIIQGETNRLSRLIDNILSISRIESGVVKIQREHVTLPQMVREAVDVMQPQARAKHIELTAATTPLYFQVFADRDMIHQSLLNYISNAIKYTPEGGKVNVELSVDEHDQMVTVAVSDNGAGIPDEDLPHLFDKFYRVSNHKKLAKGTGLGLNLVKHVIETVHGGKVNATSKPNEGSTFTFSLPIAENV